MRLKKKKNKDESKIILVLHAVCSMQYAHVPSGLSVTDLAPCSYSSGVNKDKAYAVVGVKTQPTLRI